MEFIGCTFAMFLTLLMVHSSLQIPQLVDCPDNFLEKIPSAKDSCGVITCVEAGYTSMNCGSWDCMPGKHVGYIETDNSKPYPACCGGFVCAE